jgi:tRNA G18 (ribose-2'-O)-methylase SpoU
MAITSFPGLTYGSQKWNINIHNSARTRKSWTREPGLAILGVSTTAEAYPLRKLTHEELLARSVPADQASQRERTPVAGMLDNIRSLYNVGSMFRTSDGAFVRRLYLCGYTPAPPRAEIAKTSLGATESVPWLHYRDPLLALAHARSEGMTICVLEHTTQSVPVYTLTRDVFPVCLVVGNEITGVTREVIARADIAVDIPMYGVKQSLNAAVAYGVALFELMRILKAPT